MKSGSAGSASAGSASPTGASLTGVSLDRLQEGSEHLDLFILRRQLAKLEREIFERAGKFEKVAKKLKDEGEELRQLVQPTANSRRPSVFVSKQANLEEGMVWPPSPRFLLEFPKTRSPQSSSPTPVQTSTSESMTPVLSLTVAGATEVAIKEGGASSSRSRKECSSAFSRKEPSSAIVQVEPDSPCSISTASTPFNSFSQDMATAGLPAVFAGLQPRISTIISAVQRAATKEWDSNEPSEERRASHRSTPRATLVSIDSGEMLDPTEAAVLPAPIAVETVKKTSGRRRSVSRTSSPAVGRVFSSSNEPSSSSKSSRSSETFQRDQSFFSQKSTSVHMMGGRLPASGRSTPGSKISCGSEATHKTGESMRFEPCPFWESYSSLSRSKQAYRMMMTQSEQRVSLVSEPELSVMNYRLRSLIASPSSFGQLLWEITSILFIGWDFVMIPLQFFEPESTTGINTIEWIARIFWTLVIPRNFFLGYFKQDGEVEMDPVIVWRNYLTGWFAFDVFVVMIDWAAVIMDGMDFIGAMRITKVVRFMRLVRLMRLARLVRVPPNLEQLFQTVNSEKVSLYLGIARITCFFVMLAHLISCMWYALGSGYDDNGASWVLYYNVADVSLGRRYAISVHWAVTQFTGTMEVFPQNVYERVFSVAVLIVGFVVSAAFVSQITARMTRLQMITEGQDRKVSVLRHYLLHHKVPAALTVRVVRSARFALHMQSKNALEKDIELLGMISEPLRLEIHYKIYMPVMKVHAFFNHYDLAVNVAMQRICHLATDMIVANTGDVLFSAGETPKVPSMYFVMHGLMKYRLSVHFKSTSDPEMQVTVGMWASEAALWVQWVHVGDMMAVSNCSTLALNKDAFQQIAKDFRDVSTFVMWYATNFLTYINASANISDVSLDWNPEVEVAEALETVSQQMGKVKTDSMISLKAGGSAASGSVRESMRDSASLARL